MDNFKSLTPGLKFLDYKKKREGMGEKNRGMKEDEIQSVKGVA